MTSPIHSIRLSGPWEVEPLAGLRFFGSDSDGPESDSVKQSAEPPATPIQRQRIKLPVSWQEIFHEFTGTAKFLRKFNSPTGLSQQKLWIRIDHPTGRATVQLNSIQIGQLTPEQESFRFEVSKLIQPANLLELLWEQHTPVSPETALWKNIFLEIEE